MPLPENVHIHHKEGPEQGITKSLEFLGFIFTAAFDIYLLANNFHLLNICIFYEKHQKPQTFDDIYPHQCTANSSEEEENPNTRHSKQASMAGRNASSPKQCCLNE